MRDRQSSNFRQLVKTLLLSHALLLAANVGASDFTSLVKQRLDYMEAVAAYKWQHTLPIENPQREAFVLQQAVNQGLRFGMTKESSRAFFTAQIEAAKEIQNYWIQQWRSQGGSQPQSGPNLDHDIRPALIELGEEITAALAEGNLELHDLEVEGLSQNSVARLNSAARAVTRYPNRLEQVLDSGILRVGTTGDYAPFSFRPDGKDGLAKWSGIDIDLARNLAHALGVKIQWVHTSWPTLMADLHNGSYDIGMSGISINLQRQQSAFFSKAYHSGGKAPLIRCADAGKYTSLADIDKKGTRIIVNPGGTNQKYVDANIHQASIQLHNDNRNIFDEIVNNNADVMITDQIEVQLQTGKHPQLCPAMKNQTLTFSQKGFLLPRDIIWQQYVNAWLNQRQGEGTLEKLFKAHL